MSTTTSLKYDDVNVGDELPQLDIPLTRTLIVATAIASRDYQDVHHDPGLAQERGSKDIFMNILTSNGFVGRFVTDWAGPDTLFKSVKIRLGARHDGDDRLGHQEGGRRHRGVASRREQPRRPRHRHGSLGAADMSERPEPGR